MSLLARRITAAASKQHRCAATGDIPLYDYLCRSFSSTSSPKLAYEFIVDGKVEPHNNNDRGSETIVFLHGLLGNAKNLRTPAKKITRQMPNLSALLLDVRGHGGSSGSHYLQPHNFNACVQDIFETLKPLGLTDANSPMAIIGHSLGGRIGLQYTHSLQLQEQNHGIQVPKQTWILDSVPGTPDPSVHHVLKAISSIPLPIQCKSTLTETLISEYKMNKAVAMWIATNLKGKKNEHSWIFDLDVANELVDNFADQNFSEMINEITNDNSNDSSSDSTIQLVMAGRNKEWKDDIVSELQSIPSFNESFFMHKLENAGHWVHVDAVNELTQLMVDGLSNIRR